MTVPVIHYDEAAAESAWRIYSALLKAEQAQPLLRDSLQWARIKREAYVRFETAFRGGQ